MSQGRYCRPAYQASQSHDSGTAVSRSGRSFLDHEPNSPYGCCARPHPILSLGSATTVAMDGTRALDIWCGTGRTIPHWSTSSAQSPRASSLALSCCKAEREGKGKLLRGAQNDAHLDSTNTEGRPTAYLRLCGYSFLSKTADARGRSGSAAANRPGSIHIAARD